ncbi:TPA: hypothetical protein ACH3X3_008233 [Trebouxia sp. C0006]
MRAPSLSNRVKLYQPFWRPHNTMIEVQGDVVIKDIEDTATFYADFGHSFQSIKAAHTCAQSCDSLVSHYNVKETTQKKRRANVAATKGLRVSSGLIFTTGMRVHWIMPAATQQKAISIRLE